MPDEIHDDTPVNDAPRPDVPANAETDINEDKPKGKPSLPLRAYVRRYWPHTLVGLLAVMVAAFGLYLAQVNSREDSLNLVGSLMPMGNFTTVRVQAAKVGIEVHIQNDALCHPYAEYLINGVVEAGVDLTQAIAVSLDENGVYNITLPQPQVTRCDFQPRRYYEDIPGCISFDFDQVDKIASYVTAHDPEDGIIQQIIDNDIIARAERETRLRMENIVRALRDSEVIVTFVPPETAPDLPPSCVRDEPDGWVRYPDGSWRPE